MRQLFAEIKPKDLLVQLQQCDEGRSFLAQLEAFLDEFGWRTDGLCELAAATWRENPLIPLNTLQGYVSLDADHDPDVQLQQAAERRDQLLGAARRNLTSDPDRLARFNSLYEAARHCVPVTEDHNYYIDQMGNCMMRRPILELGRRLARLGTLAGENDIFLLYLAEVREALAGTDQRFLVSRRRTDMERWSRVVPPLTVGELPPPIDDPWVEAIFKMAGMPPEPSSDASIIIGIGASPGTVQGRAKVVRSLSEASKVEPGDVLVCEMTLPAWAPLFSTVSAVVADTGGVLSHCAIVAREYRLPCVVQTVVGTATIKDGMRLSVDGSKGIVRIDSRM